MVVVIVVVNKMYSIKGEKAPKLKQPDCTHNTINPHSQLIYLVVQSFKFGPTLKKVKCLCHLVELKFSIGAVEN